MALELLRGVKRSGIQVSSQEGAVAFLSGLLCPQQRPSSSQEPAHTPSTAREIPREHLLSPPGQEPDPGLVEACVAALLSRTREGVWGPWTGGQSPSNKKAHFMGPSFCRRAMTLDSPGNSPCQGLGSSLEALHVAGRGSSCRPKLVAPDSAHPLLFLP